MNQIFKSTHNLTFETADWHDPQFQLFRIGSCEGLWGATEESYLIVAVTNSKPGNGHFEDVLEIFENSCKRDGKTLKVVEIMNADFMQHLITKRGFKKIAGSNCEKEFDVITKSDWFVVKGRHGVF